MGNRFSPLPGDIRLTRIEIIGSIVADRYGVSCQMLKTRSRLREICEPRQITMYIAYKVTAFTYAVIGHFFNRDHTTVLHAVRQCENLIETDASFRNKMEELMLECKACIASEQHEIKDKYKHTIQLSGNKAIMLIGFNNTEVQLFKEHNSL